MRSRRSSENTERVIRRFPSLKFPFAIVVCGLWSVVCSISCAPTYNAQKAAQSIVDILRDEYQLTAHAKLKDSTLGVLYPVENLVDSQLNLIPDRLEGMEHVALAMHRVGLSTDTDQIQFYTIMAQDPITSVELTLSGFFLDVKRVRLLDISRDEYFKRIVRDLKFNPEILGENTIRKMFGEIAVQKSELVLEKYYSKTTAPEEAKTVLFPTSLIALPDSSEYILQEVQTKRISPTKALVFIHTREYYAVQSQFRSLLTVFPQGFGNEYLFVIDANLYPRVIERIVPKYSVDPDGRILEKPLRKTFDEYPNLIQENDRFFLEEFSLPAFLVQLIEHRIRDSVGRDQGLSQKITLRSVQGSFDTDKKDFTFSLVALPAANTQTSEGSQTQLFEASLKVTAEVLKGYWFKDYQAINLVDVLSGSSISINRDNVEQFRLKKIGIQQLLQNSYLTPFNP